MAMKPLAILFGPVIAPIFRPNEFSKVIRDLFKGHVPCLEIPAFVVWLLFTKKRGEKQVVGEDSIPRKINNGKEKVSGGRMAFEKSTRCGGVPVFYNLITDQMVSPLHGHAEPKPGDHYVIKSPLVGVRIPDLIDIQPQAYVLIYGQILDARNCRPGFFNVIAYSAMCPSGEEAELCILDITRVINRDEFEAARRECWTV
jgi:hypothetical protein